MNTAAPFEQVRREVLQQVAAGELRPGDRLPAIRARAEELHLAPGTVARAYRMLEEQQVVTTRRGAGTTIAPGALAAARAARETLAREGGGEADADLVELFAEPVRAARRMGRGDVEILAAVRAALRA